MKTKSLLILLLVMGLIVLGYFLIPKLFKSSKQVEKSIEVLPFKKSIAALPFRNDSPDETNVYFLNGIMEEILNNLLMIKELRVLSRTSVENYKKIIKTIPEIAKELGVSMEEGRQTLRELYSKRVAGWLAPGTDFIASFAPFNNQPTQFRITIDSQQKWFGQ
jgi:hypothetical protein